MNIIREATTTETLDYWAERAPSKFNARPNEAMIQSFRWSDPVERVAVKAKRALNSEFYSQIPLDDLEKEYEKYDFEYEGEREINGGLYLVVSGFLGDWVNEDNYFNICLDELDNFHPLRE